MLIVLPFHAGDEWLALKNLELCKQLDGKSKHPCLLAYDSTTAPDAVAKLTAEYFSEVHHFKHDRWSGEKTWPAPQNWAWQSVARHISDHFRDGPWFWWEADVTPLCAGWIDKLEKEYELGGKLFMGHMVPTMNHMNGVALYPGNIVSHAGNALLTQKHPFDIVLTHSIGGLIHAANHIMAHFPRYTGITLSFTDADALARLKDKGAVIFHGCNDGTLADLVAGRTPKPKTDGLLQRFYTLEDVDGEFNQAEMFWQKDCISLKKKGHPCAPFEECSKELPPFAEQTPWKAGQFDLPLTEEVCHFNPGLVRDGGGNLWLLARRWDRIKNAQRNWLVGWNSSLTACKIDEDSMKVVSQKRLEIRKRQRGEQHEDPRVIWHNNQFWVSYCSWTHGTKYSAKQEFSAFDSNWHFRGNAHVKYGNNPYHIAGHEKNWIWFNHDNAWHFVYSFSPHTVVRVGSHDQTQEFKTETKPAWAYGEVRGGTPPVRVGDEYISFFHSSMPWKGRQKRYYMGAYAFEAKAPFRATRITPTPIMGGSDQDTRINGGPPCIFACGSVFDGKEWIVSFGVNDEACGWAKVPHRKLQKKFVSV